MHILYFMLFWRAACSCPWARSSLLETPEMTLWGRSSQQCSPLLSLCIGHRETFDSPARSSPSCPRVGKFPDGGCRWLSIDNIVTLGTTFFFSLTSAPGSDALRAVEDWGSPMQEGKGVENLRVLLFIEFLSGTHSYSLPKERGCPILPSFSLTFNIR